MNDVLKIYDYEDYIFEDVEEAKKWLVETKFEREVDLYDINSKKAYNKCLEIYRFVKEYNKGKPLDEQILPSNPYSYRGIKGCLGVQCYGISMGTYKKNRECIALFTNWNESVLDISNEKPEIRPGIKALSSMTLMAGFMSSN